MILVRLTAPEVTVLRGPRPRSALVRGSSLWNNRAKRRSDLYYMSDYIDSDGFRANVGIVLMRDDRRVFLGGRTGGRGWQFPQGGVLRHESPEEALYRELKEEIGLDRADVALVAATRTWLRYRLPKQYVRRNSDPPCIGQKQKWFLLRLVASEELVHFDATEQPEFEAWRWVDYWTPVREVIYFKRAVYVRALDELARRAFPDDPPALPEWSMGEKNMRSLVERQRRLAAGE
jgi:putative (di)nucleoside polyphosphate hydrolase